MLLRITCSATRTSRVRSALAAGAQRAFLTPHLTPEGRETLAQSMLQLMDAHGFRGLDVDWEYPATSAGGLKHRADDWENYFQLLALLREGLDARAEATGQGYVLSVALGASDSLIQAVDGTRLGALVDQANIMTYDFTGF